MCVKRIESRRARDIGMQGVIYERQNTGRTDTPPIKSREIINDDDIEDLEVDDGHEEEQDGSSDAAALLVTGDNDKLYRYRYFLGFYSKLEEKHCKRPAYKRISSKAPNHFLYFDGEVWKFHSELGSKNTILYAPGSQQREITYTECFF